jgi:hypothetical protein
MKNKKRRGKERIKGVNRSGKDLEEQAQDIMRSSDLEELDRAEIPEELRERLREADVYALDDMEKELGFQESVGEVETPAVETLFEEETSVEGTSMEKPFVEEMTVDERPDTADSRQLEEAVYDDVEHAAQTGEAIDASCTVKISDDKMSALISLYPSQNDGRPLDYEMAKNELEAAGVVYGINEDLLKKLVITVENTHEEKEGVIIAKGLPPEEGKDGVIEYHFGEDEAILDQDDEEEESG